MRDGRVHGDHAGRRRPPGSRSSTRWSGPSRRVQRRPHAAGRRGLRGRPTLDVHDPDEPEHLRVAGASLTLRAGEVVGLFGLVGAGCGALAQGPVRLVARPGRGLGAPRRPGDRRPRSRRGASGAGHRHDVPGPPRDADAGCIGGRQHRAREPRPPSSPRGILDVQRKQAVAARQTTALSIRARSTDQRVGSLSGGNQQKVQVARWLTAGSRVLLLDDPTRGVDVGARAEIHGLLRGMAVGRLRPAAGVVRCRGAAGGVRPDPRHARRGHRAGDARGRRHRGDPAERGGRAVSHRVATDSERRAGAETGDGRLDVRQAPPTRSRSATTPCCWSWRSRGWCSRS